MSAPKLASRYAKSLLDFAVEKGKLEDVHKDQLYLSQVLKLSKVLNQVLGSPLISPDRKIKALQTVLGKQVSELTMVFLQLLVKKSREVYLKEIADSFLFQYDLHKNVTQVKIISAAPLEQNEIDKLLNKLRQEAKLENVHLSTGVDENLIGGFMLQYGDKQYDASIARSFDTLKKELNDNEYFKKLR